MFFNRGLLLYMLTYSIVYNGDNGDSDSESGEFWCYATSNCLHASLISKNTSSIIAVG